MKSSTQHTALSTKATTSPGLSLVLSAYCVVLLVTGCVHRSLTIRTEPPGATVYVNDAFKGQSPVTYDFLWYGWQRVTVSKTGYQRIEDRKFLQAPAYLWIPCDMVMELLPIQIRDERSWSYTLIPHPELPSPNPPSTTNNEGGTN